MTLAGQASDRLGRVERQAWTPLPRMNFPIKTSSSTVRNMCIITDRCRDRAINEQQSSVS